MDETIKPGELVVFTAVEGKRWRDNGHAEAFMIGVVDSMHLDDSDPNERCAAVRFPNKVLRFLGHEIERYQAPEGSRMVHDFKIGDRVRLTEAERSRLSAMYRDGNYPHVRFPVGVVKTGYWPVATGGDFGLSVDWEPGDLPTFHWASTLEPVPAGVFGRGEKVRLTAAAKARMKGTPGLARNAAEFGDCVGIIDGLIVYKEGNVLEAKVEGPEYDVRWQPSGLRYAYAPEDLELVSTVTLPCPIFAKCHFCNRQEAVALPSEEARLAWAKTWLAEHEKCSKGKLQVVEMQLAPIAEPLVGFSIPLC